MIRNTTNQDKNFKMSKQINRYFTYKKTQMPNQQNSDKHHFPYNQNSVV